MINVSIQQLINLWVQLEDAYNDENGYGGTVAEIYAYTLQPRTPGYAPNSDNPFRNFDEKSKEIEFNASKSLYNILTLFKSKRKCVIKIENKRLGKWLLKERFNHRLHIEIIKKKG